MYKIEFSRTAEKELVKIYKTNKKLYSRIINTVENLSEDPMLGKALKNVLKGYYSYRLGTYRIIYEVSHKKLIVTVIDIGHRRNIYD